MFSPLWPLLKSFSLQELLHHPWRNVAAVVSVMLGVALAFAVHLINESALDEFSQAVRSVDGKADLELRSTSVNAEFSEAILSTLLQRPEVSIAAPVLELSTYALLDSVDGKPPQRQLLRIVAVDALQMGLLAPDLMPLPSGKEGRMALFAPDTVFLNAMASLRLGSTQVNLQQGMQLKSARVAGSVRAGGSPLAVMDIGAAQDFFGRQGRLSRVDIRLKPGTDRDAFVRALQSSPGWSKDVVLSPPGDAAERVGNLSRAYRVNLTVLALIALFTGGFLVFSVLALSVSRRAQQFALLGVLGLTGRQRLQLVLLEAAVLGLLGSALGIALGTGLSATALRLLGGDLGGGYFPGAAPALQWSYVAALVFATLGVATALLGAWWPARLAQSLPPAQTLKGLGASLARHQHAWIGPSVLLTGVLLALMPPVAGVPLAAYVSVGLLLMGGIVALPWLVGVVLDRLAPWVAHKALPMLAVERARRVRESVAVAVSGVVASLSLAVALTVMVSSFRLSVTSWLDTVLPASLYVRSAVHGSANELSYFDAAFVQAASRVAGVERISVQRNVPLNLDDSRPAVVLMVRSLRDPASGILGLPLVGEALPAPAGQIGIYVSEAMVDLYGARAGARFTPLEKIFAADPRPGSTAAPVFFVAGVWRDYARQFGSIALDRADFARLSDDTRVNDIAFWLTPEASVDGVEQTLRDLADRLDPAGGGHAGQLLEFGSAAQIRAITLKIFDRSFAVTYWLQAVAVGIGLFGVAASFSAQVLARRKEFGLLAHLGLTRRQILRVVAMEGATWTALGALAGVLLGLAVSVVLVHVVNPQSFHWTMELTVPWLRLLTLSVAVIAAGTITAWASGRSAAGRDSLMAVKEDW
jgi:putative ABC transport system permease protein